MASLFPPAGLLMRLMLPLLPASLNNSIIQQRSWQIVRCVQHMASFPDWRCLMHVYFRSTLILAALFAVMASPAMAEDMPMAPAENAVERPAFPILTAPGEPIAPAIAAPDANAPGDEPMAIEDEEAPAADVPGVEPFAVPEPQTSNGPKSPTDKIVDTFMLLDTDESKTVSMQEYLIMVQQRVQARFEAMDTNRDGEISEDEYRTFWKSRMAKWYRLQR